MVICEGERAADSAQKILGDSVITVSWSNGAAAVDFTDWKPIKDRSLVLWPDHDDPGYAAMSKIFLKLCKFNHTIKLIKFFGKDFGWDAHDSFLMGECVNLSESRNYTPEEYKIIDVKNWTPADFEFHEFDI